MVIARVQLALRQSSMQRDTARGFCKCAIVANSNLLPMGCEWSMFGCILFRVFEGM